MSATSRVLVIVPAYNESGTILAVVRDIRTATPGYDILVVDDGSTDHTARVVETVDGILSIRLPFNLGIGGCMQTGYKYAFRNGYDIAVQCDADGQHPADRIPNLVARLADGTADAVIGSRYVANSDYLPSFGRRLGKSLLSRWIDFWVGGGITDTTSGFRAFNRKAIALAARDYPEDYPEPEMLVILHRHGLRAVEIPASMRPRQGGTTSIFPHRAVYYMIKVCLAVFIDAFRRYARTTEESS